jgi:hypothetical protein
MIGSTPESPMVAIAADAGLMQYRRLLRDLIDRESPSVGTAKD